MSAVATSSSGNKVYLVTSGDLRLSANQVCWPAQQDLETRLTAAPRRQRP